MPGICVNPRAVSLALNFTMLPCSSRFFPSTYFLSTNLPFSGGAVASQVVYLSLEAISVAIAVFHSPASGPPSAVETDGESASTHPRSMTSPHSPCLEARPLRVRTSGSGSQVITSSADFFSCWAVKVSDSDCPDRVAGWRVGDPGADWWKAPGVERIIDGRVADSTDDGSGAVDSNRFG